MVSWNIGKGLCKKLNDSDFLEISEEDVIECPGYSSFAFPRKSGRGGGIVIFYKHNLYNIIIII